MNEFIMATNVANILNPPIWQQTMALRWRRAAECAPVLEQAWCRTDTGETEWHAVQFVGPDL